MPFDVRDFPGDARAASRASRRLIAGWLFLVCGMIAAMILLGGATRLSGSGLSIMEWAPLTGVLPPVSEAEWQRLFALYQQTPQYALVNAGFGLDGFKHIFWLEWVHRLVGRLVGAAFLLPLLWFWVSGRIERRLLPRLALLFALGGLQGAVGWFMVASGWFPESTAVAPSRLVVHLALALALYAALLWTALSVLHPWPAPTAAAQAGRLRAGVGVLCGMIALTMLAGGLVAGTHAGLAYNTFPLMEGQLVPRAYALENFIANIATVQFNHRLLATLTLLAALGVAIAGLRAGLPRPGRRAVLVSSAAVAGQYLLGVITLLALDPAPLAMAHQTVAVLALSAALVALHALRSAR